MPTKKQPRVIAVIPARGGSVSIPKKNIKLLAGRPLIDWVIQPALVDCVLESRIGKGAPYLSFAAFVESVCAVSARFDGNRSWRANTYIVLARFLLPMASARAAKGGAARAAVAWGPVTAV